MSTDKRISNTGAFLRSAQWAEAGVEASMLTSTCVGAWVRTLTRLCCRQCARRPEATVLGHGPEVTALGYDLDP